MKTIRKIDIKGFGKKPKRTASGGLYQGRFTCHDVQWTGEGEEVLATFTITAEELADVAESQLMWTDQDVQRGIRPDASPNAPRELAVGAGYPDPKLYIFDAANADDIAEKLLRGERVFLGPLVWNLVRGRLRPSGTGMQGQFTSTVESYIFRTHIIVSKELLRLYASIGIPLPHIPVFLLLSSSRLSFTSCPSKMRGTTSSIRTSAPAPRQNRRLTI